MATDNPSPPAQKPAKIGRFKIVLNILVQITAFVLLLFMVNYLSFNHYKRWDFSRTHFYSLSEKSKRVLAGLKKPVKAIVFFPAGSQISVDVDNLLKEYQYASNGKINVEIVDPDRNPTRASELQNTYKYASQENILILDCDGRKKFISDRDMVDLDTSGERMGEPPQITAFKGEEVVTAAILAITDDKPNILYAISGHGERDIASDDFAIIRNYIERENIKVQPLNLQNVDAVPGDAGVLFVAGARYDFSEREMKLLGDYWEKKGRLFIMLDPNAQKQTPNLMAFLAKQGVKPDDDRIMRVESVGTVAALVRYVTAEFLAGSPITKNLNSATGLFQGDTQSLTLDQAGADAAGIRLQMLAEANKGYWGETDYNIKEGDPVPYFVPTKDHGQPLAVVASVEKGALERVQVDSSRMIAAGNCEFVSRQSIAAGANLDFTINAIDWLLDRAELIGVAPKAYNTLSLNLTDSQMTNILVTAMGVIPGAIGVLGFVVWWRRRH